MGIKSQSAEQKLYMHCAKFQMMTLEDPQHLLTVKPMIR
jgi:hypothetical protein